MNHKIKSGQIILIIIALSSMLWGENIDLVTCTNVAANKLSQMGKASEFSISNKVQIKDLENEKILFNVFELQPQGYIVTSADNDLPPIIAYSFKSSFFNEGSDDVLLDLLKTDIQLRLENVSRLPDKLISERNDAWFNLLNEQNRNIRFEQWPPEGTTPTGGWLLETWNQSAPYNNFVPMDLISGSRSLAGCPSIAMGEILNYHRTTNSVQFDDEDDYYHNYAGRTYWIDNDHEELDFLSFPEMNECLDTLASHYFYQQPVTSADKAALVFACGVAATQVYTSGGSGTFGVDQAYDAYQKFNFADAQLIDDTNPEFYDLIIDNIMNALPVHFATVTPAWDSGHNFVVDGYNTDDYYHINFGWGGSYNGWYLLPDEIPYGLTVVEGAVVDIMPDVYTGLLTGQITLDPPLDDASVVTINLQNLSGDQIFEVEIDASGTAAYLFEVPIGLYSVTASCPGFESITSEEIMIEEDLFTYLDYYLYQLIPPAELTGEQVGSEIYLYWQSVRDRNFQYFNIFRNISDSHFVLLDTTTESNYADTIDPQETLTYGYYITAVYSQENESEASDTIYVEITGTSIEDQVLILQELSNYPNPFNPTTIISFSLTTRLRSNDENYAGQAESTELCIYNIKGQKVKAYSIRPRSCHPERSRRTGADKYSITWNGTNDNDQPVTSGIYYYVLRSGNSIIAANKCLLLK